MTIGTRYRKQLQEEVDALPDEYLPYILHIVQTFRDSVMLKPAADSLKQGWHEARTGDVAPLHTLWHDIEVE